MSVIVTIEVPAEEFVFGTALGRDHGLQVTLERVVPLGSTFSPYFWARGDSIEDVERALRTEPDVESFEILDRVDDEAFVSVEWKEDLNDLLDTMAVASAKVLQGVGSAESWTFQLRFDDHDSLSEFYRQCVDHDLTISLRSVHSPDIPAVQGLGLGLTETQRETLQTALERGYFDVPRQSNLTELSAEMDVSDTAVSQRIRRGITTLLVATLNGGRKSSDAGIRLGRDTRRRGRRS